jgi:hypothetical protein
MTKHPRDPLDNQVSKHTTKSGPGRRHVEGAYGNGKIRRPWKVEGNKLATKAKRKTIGVINP